MHFHKATSLTLTASLVFVALVFLGWVNAAEASRIQDTEDVLRVDTQLVLVDVVARDRDGTVDDLEVEDLTIFDNGVRQEITVFEMTPIDQGAEEAAPPPPSVASNMRDWRGAAPAGATIVLVDRLNTPTDIQAFVNDRVLEFVESFDELDRLALYEISGEGVLRIVHDYTTQPEELARKAAELEPEHSLLLAGSDANAGFEASLDTVGVDRELVQFLDRGVGDFREFERQSADMFLDIRIQRTLEALESITYHMRGLPGRKNLVWLSGRFPFTFDPYNRTDLTEEVDQTTVAWMEEVGFLLTDANIALYPVDVRGPGVDGDAEFNGVIRTIAEMTGGRPFYGTNSVGEAVTEAVEDARAVYTLGFYPSEPGTDRSYRNLTIEIDREDVELNHRPGYFAFGGRASAAPARGLADFLVAPLDATAITLVGSASRTDQNQDYQVLVLAEASDLNLVEQNGSWVGEIDFVGFFQSELDGSASVLPAETIPIRMSEEQYQGSLATGFLLQKIVNTNGHTGRMRFVVRDRTTGAAGSLWIPVRAAGGG